MYWSSDKLRNIMNKVKKQYPFKFDAMVVLPDHIHAIWTLPVNDNNFATRWIFTANTQKGKD